MSSEYKEALLKAQAQLAELEERRESLLRLIENLRVLAEDELYELTPPPGYEPEGLTAEIRKILTLTTLHLTAPQIRDSLSQRGFAESNPRTLLISVHTVLGRIEKELDVIQRDGKSAYKAKRNLTTADMIANTLRATASADMQKFLASSSKSAMEEFFRKMAMTPPLASAILGKKENK